MNARFTDSVMPSRSHTQLLSGLAAAGTVRRLWTGAEAKNVNLIDLDRPCSRTRSRPGDGTNERLHWWESLVTFRHPVLTRRYVSLATTGTHGRLRTRLEFLHPPRHCCRRDHWTARSDGMGAGFRPRAQGRRSAGSAHRGRHRRRSEGRRRRRLRRRRQKWSVRRWKCRRRKWPSTCRWKPPRRPSRTSRTSRRRRLRRRRAACRGHARQDEKPGGSGRVTIRREPSAAKSRVLRWFRLA